MISLWRKCLSGKCCPWPGCFSSIQNFNNWLTADINESKSLWMLLTSTFRFHNSWLRFCCQCEKCKQAHSGQRTIDVLSVGDPIELSDFSVSSKCSLKQHTYYSLSKLITCQQFKYKKLYYALLSLRFSRPTCCRNSKPSIYRWCRVSATQAMHCLA